MNNFIRIKKSFINTTIIEKSEFICYLKRCMSEDEAKNFIKDIKKKHYDATHVCSAYLIDEYTQKSSDDGEPSGTAGMPMLEILRKNNVINICACVVRYFGGIKLGAGGLIRAYSGSVNEALKLCDKVRLELKKVYQCKFDYSFINKFDYFLLSNGSVIDKQFELDVTYVFVSDNENIENDIIKLSNGKVTPLFLEERIIEIDM